MKLMIIGLVLIGCCRELSTVRGEPALGRYEDRDSGVVCYTIDAYKTLSCVKVKSDDVQTVQVLVE